MISFRLISTLTLVSWAFGCGRSLQDETAPCDADLGHAGPSDATDGRLKREAPFWEAIQIEAEWAHYYPTLAALSGGSDLVATGDVARVESGPTIEADEPEASVMQVEVDVNTTEVIRGAPLGCVPLTLILPSVFNEAQRDATIAAMNDARPREVTFLLAQTDTGYRVVNGYGIWARTLRDPAYDAPLEVDHHSVSGVYAEEMARIQTLDQLTDAFRP